MLTLSISVSIFLLLFYCHQCRASLLINDKFLNPIKLLVDELSFVLSISLIVSACLFPGFFLKNCGYRYFSLFYHFWTSFCFLYSTIMKMIKKQLYVIFSFLRSELESPVFYEKIFSIGQDWRSVFMILNPNFDHSTYFLFNFVTRNKGALNPKILIIFTVLMHFLHTSIVFYI